MLNQDIRLFVYKLCQNGHLIYSQSGPIADNFCVTCGSSYVTKCPDCATPLPSNFSSPVFLTSGKPVRFPSIPGACSKCGKVFPWTLKKATHANMSDIEALAAVINICSRFHIIAKQLLARHDSRNTLDIDDEYDVQDLLHSLLRVHFDDIRAEEWTPSYAGGSARVDFLIKPYMILIEVKKTRAGLANKELGNQLIEDVGRYKQIHDAKALVCFIYDPSDKVVNPAGFVSDLEKLDKSITLKVIITPLR